MKKQLLAFAAIVALAAPVSAQQYDLSIWASQASIQGDNEFDGVALDFDEEIGYGAALNYYWGDMLSTELAVYFVEADGTMVIPSLGETIDLGALEMTPVTLTMQLHLLRGSRFNVRLGAGAAYVDFQNLASRDLVDVGIDVIEVDGALGWHANAGFGIELTRNIALTVDAKYLFLEAETEGPGGDDDEVTLELDPLIVSAGLRFRF